MYYATIFNNTKKNKIMSKYKVWKKSINEVRIADREGNIVYEGPTVELTNPTFRVNYDGYLEAKKRNFKDSGNPLDFFSWIECDDFTVNPKVPTFGYRNRIRYNPFVHPDWHMRNNVDHSVRSAKSCYIVGNSLYVN